MVDAELITAQENLRAAFDRISRLEAEILRQRNIEEDLRRRLLTQEASGAALSEYVEKIRTEARERIASLTAKVGALQTELVAERLRASEAQQTWREKEESHSKIVESERRTRKHASELEEKAASALRRFEHDQQLIARLEREAAALREAHEESRKEAEAAKAALRESRGEQAAQAESLSELERRITKLESVRAALAEQLEAEEARAEGQLAEIARASARDQGRIRDLEEVVRRQEREELLLNEKIELATRDLAASRRKLEKLALEHEKLQENQQLHTLTQGFERSRLEQELIDSAEKLGMKEAREAELTAVIAELTSKSTALQEDLQRERERNAGFQAEIATLARANAATAEKMRQYDPETLGILQEALADAESDAAAKSTQAIQSERNADEQRARFEAAAQTHAAEIATLRERETSHQAAAEAIQDSLFEAQEALVAEKGNSARLAAEAKGLREEIQRIRAQVAQEKERNTKAEAELHRATHAKRFLEARLKDREFRLGLFEGSSTTTAVDRRPEPSV